MTTRRFEAASTPAALDAVRAAFGEDAFILSNRRLGDRVEIIATGPQGLDLATAEQELETTGSGQADGAARTTRLRIESVADPETPVDPTAPAGLDAAAIEALVRTAIQTSLSTLLPRAVMPPDAGEQDESCAPDADPWSANGDVDAVPEDDLSADTIPDPQAAAVVAATGVTLSAEVDNRLRRIEVALWGREDVPRSHLLDRLLQLGLGTATAVRLSEQARGADTDALMRDALVRLRDSLPILRDDGKGLRGVKLLSGPDSDARLAVMLQFARTAIAAGGQRSVALVSADTKRPGAFPMLEECARTLGCVTMRVRHPDDLESTLASLADRDCVLVDAGDAWPASRSVKQRLLVLPATLQRTACEAAIDKARAARASGCVLSGLSAPGRPGESLEALIDRWLPIAFWSDNHDIDTAPRRAEAALIVAAAIGAARRLGGSEHDRLLGSLLHPGRGGLATGFVSAVQLPGEGAPRRGTAAGGTPQARSVDTTEAEVTA